jgi:excisionase family DNA binding protein
MEDNMLTLSVPEAGQLAGIGKNASYAAARRGEIPVIKLGGKYRVPAAKWRRMLAEGLDSHDGK